MPSLAQLSLMTNLLKLSNFKAIDYNIQENIGIFLKIEKIDRRVTCPCCGRTTDKLHENYWSIVKDLPWGEQSVYLQVNRRVMRCERCQNKFKEELGIVKKKRTHTIRLRNQIVSEVLSGDIKNAAKRNELSEDEIETMLKDIYEELKPEKPAGLRKLGIDVRSYS